MAPLDWCSSAFLMSQLFAFLCVRSSQESFNCCLQNDSEGCESNSLNLFTLIQKRKKQHVCCENDLTMTCGVFGNLGIKSEINLTQPPLHANTISIV